MRHLAVEQDGVLQVALQHSLLVELDRRDADALLEDVGVAFYMYANSNFR